MTLLENLVKKLMRLIRDVNFNCLFQYTSLNGKTAWSSAFQKETFSDKKAETASNFLFQ